MKKPEIICHFCGEYEQDCGCVANHDLKALRAERDRYKAALEEIGNDPANAVTHFEDKWRTIARDALKPKSDPVTKDDSSTKQKPS